MSEKTKKGYMIEVKGMIDPDGKSIDECYVISVGQGGSARIATHKSLAKTYHSRATAEKKADILKKVCKTPIDTKIIEHPPHN